MHQSLAFGTEPDSSDQDRFHSGMEPDSSGLDRFHSSRTTKEFGGLYAVRGGTYFLGSQMSGSPQNQQVGSWAGFLGRFFLGWGLTCALVMVAEDGSYRDRWGQMAALFPLGLRAEGLSSGDKRQVLFIIHLIAQMNIQLPI